jgi:hypothetical protein
LTLANLPNRGKVDFKMRPIRQPTR